MTAATGIVRINEHTIELPEEEARTLFLAACVSMRKGIPLVMSRDVTVYIGQAADLCLTIAGAFGDAYDPQGAIDSTPRG